MLDVRIFGESHGPYVGVTVTGLPAGLPVREDELLAALQRRMPSGESGTQRRERDIPNIVSGVYQGATTGDPVTALFENGDARGADYAFLPDRPRPGHADYPAFVRSGGRADFRGGGHSSGRLTVCHLFAGALAEKYLQRYNVRVYGHLTRVGDVSGARVDPLSPDEGALVAARSRAACALTDELAAKMLDAAKEAKSEGDSLGGEIELVALGLPAGLGESYFEGCEALISRQLFSVPSVKAVSFGDGFAVGGMRGSAYNDEYEMSGGDVRVKSNHAGGLLGGLTDGAPLTALCALRPAASISKSQQTVSLLDGCGATLTVPGRHDACVALRAVPVLEGAVAIALSDLLLRRDGRAPL